MLLPYTDKKESIELANRLKTSLANMSFEHAISIPCSVGVTVLNDDDSYKTFVERADKAQYISKNEGKNRVTYM